MKKISNKTLLIVFLLLAAFTGIFYYLDSRNGDRTFKGELFTIDSSLVTSITIYPKGKTIDPITLVRNGRLWNVKEGSRSYPADTMTVQRILQALEKVNAERVAASGKEGWMAYQITDSLATRVVVNQGTEVKADFRVGKISFSRGQGMQGYGGNQNMIVKSHIRVAGDDNVYVIDGFLSMMFNEQLNNYRNHLVFRFNKNDLLKMTFIYPGDSSFRLNRSGAQWLVNDTPADSAAVENWLNSVTNCTGSEFADDLQKPFSFPYVLRIEGNNMKTIEVKGAMDPVTRRNYIESSFNASAIFGGTNPTLFNQVYPSKNKFQPRKK